MMNPIPESILEFIDEHHIFTLAVSTENGSWCSTCFFVYLREQNVFVFTSDPKTRHIREVVKNNDYRVSGAIALETKMVGKIRGIQFSGIMNKLYGEELKQARQAYLKTFPVARFSRLYLWGLTPGFIKMTDNRLGFGKKLIWQG
jgi:uncharacterized protein